MSPIIILLGVVGFLFIFGAGVALVVGANRGSVDERLEQFVGASGATVEATAVSEDAGSAVDGPDIADRIDKLISGQTFFEPIRKRIAQADVKLRVSEYIILVVVSTIAVPLIAFFAFSNSWLMAVIGAIVGWRLPRAYIGYTANKRVRMFNDQLGDTLNLWVNALRSGYSVLQAMEAIATELPPPVSKEFERVVQEVRLGLSINQALANMLRRAPSEDLDLIITAVNIQREVGGNLAEILDTISYTIRERVRIKGEIRTLTAQGRVSGWIISLLPIGLGLVLYLINPEYVSELWIRQEPFLIGTFPCGWLVLGLGGFTILLGALAIRKIVNIEV